MTEAAQRSRAAQLAQDMVGRLRANNRAEALRTYVSNTSPWPTAWAGRRRLSNGAPPGCRQICAPAEAARADLQDWERSIDGAAQSVGETWVGGLTQPTACIDGPSDGGSGYYTVTLSWRGNLALPASGAGGCGAAAEDGGIALYGDRDQYRRTLTLSTWITSRS